MEKEKLIENISEFPINLYAGYKDHSRLPTAEMGFRRAEDLPNITGPMSRKQAKRRKLNTQQDFYRARDTLTGLSKEPPLGTDSKNDKIVEDIGGQINLPADRKILTQKARKMSSGFFMIEVSRTDKTFFIAAMKRRNRNENYLIELEWSQSKEILSQFNIQGDDTDFDSEDERLVQSLEILDNRLVLLNPKMNTEKVVKKKRIRGSQSQLGMRIRKKPNQSPYNKKVKTADRKKRDPEGEF